MPRARFGTVLPAAAVCTSAWRMAPWWPLSPTAALSPRRCVSERASTYWMWWRKEPAAQRRSVVREFKHERHVCRRDPHVKLSGTYFGEGG